MANSAMEMSPPWKHPVASKLLMVVLTVLFNFIPYCIYKVCFRQGFRIRDVAAGSNHSAAVTSSGELYTWGLGEYGRLGHGDNLTQLTPKRVINNHSLLPTLICSYILSMPLNSGGCTGWSTYCSSVVWQ